MTATLRPFLLIGATILLGACGIFGSDDDELKPAELVDVDNTLKIRKDWSAKLGDDAEFLRLALRPASDENRIYAASADGNVSAFDPEKGSRQWRSELDTPLTAGPGVGAGLVVVVSADGWVIALGADDGAERWRIDVKGESLAVPLVSGDDVIIQTVDNRVRALDIYSGRENWIAIQKMPALTMRGSSSPIAVGSSIITGFDNGRLLSIDRETGTTQWESLLAPPSGRSDLERLSDVDGALAAVGQDIYAAGYHGRLASLAAESGQVLWALEISSFEGISADWSNVYTVQDEGIVIALSRRNGAESWRKDILLRREPTVPVPFHTAVVSGDYDGYLHFFSVLDGEYVARVKLGGAAISSAPLVMGKRLFVQSDSGSLTAYSVVEPKPKAEAAATDDGE